MNGSVFLGFPSSCSTAGINKEERDVTVEKKIKKRKMKKKRRIEREKEASRERESRGK